MTGQTVTRAQLSEAVYQEVGLSRNESAELVARTGPQRRHLLSVFSSAREQLLHLRGKPRDG